MTALVPPGSSVSLQRFRLVETHSLEEARAIHSTLNSPSEVEQIDRRLPFAWHANRVVLAGLGLAESRYGAGVRGHTRHVDRQYSLVIPRHRAGRATQHGVTADVDPGRTAALLSPEGPAAYEFGADYRGAQVSVPGHVMEATLAALVGAAWTGPLRFDVSVDLRAPCSSVHATIDAPVGSGALTVDLPTGVVFRRALGRTGASTGSTPRVTWQMTVGARSAPVNGSCDTTLDVNGDGNGDLAIVVGARFASSAQGRAYTFRGSASGLVNTPTRTLTSPDSVTGYFGAAAARLDPPPARPRSLFTAAVRGTARAGDVVCSAALK